MALGLSYFQEHPEQFDALSDEDRMSLMNGDTIEGEIDGESPDADAGETETVEQKTEAESDPVVLANDGKHTNTTPFEELQAARDSARRLEDIVRQQNELIESLKKADEAPVVPLEDQLAEIRQEIEDATLLEEGDKVSELWAKARALIAGEASAKTRAEMAAEHEARDAQARAEAEQIAVDAVANQAAKDYPFLDSNAPTANQEAIKKVIRYSNSLVAEGKPRHEALAEAVAEFAPRYVEKPIKGAEAAAAAAIANAKSKTPTSMSSIPSAASPPTDEVQAMSSMSAQSLQDKMMDLPREKILELMGKTFVK